MTTDQKDRKGGEDLYFAQQVADDESGAPDYRDPNLDMMYSGKTLRQKSPI